MFLLKRVLSIACVSVVALIGCAENPTINQEAKSGDISIHFVADAASDFASLAKTAEVKVSAEGIVAITEPLTVTQTGISGTVSGIIAGPNRKFEVFVYDNSNKLCYYGSAVGTVTAGGTANVSMTLTRTEGEGNATINGSIQSSNLPPVITMTSPANNSQYNPGDVITFAATASDADGSIANVTFYNGNTVLGNDATSPYTYSFTPTSAGTYSFSVVATDNLGATTHSSVATVTVASASSTVYQINAGGSAATPFVQDNYYSGGKTSSTTNAITTSGITNPAPQAVYQTERYGAATYTLPNLTASASYKVRLHFAEIYWTASGKRKFNVSINGTSVLANYDIYAETGARFKAAVKEYTATANASGQIVIVFTTVTDNATISGIEIIKNQPDPVWTLLATKTSSNDLSRAILDANEKLYFAEVTIGVTNELALQTLNSSGSIVTAATRSGFGSFNGIGLEVGNDGTTLYAGNTQTVISWNGTSWSVVADNMSWNSVGGFGLHVGASNNIYITSMDNNTFDQRIRRLNNGVWDIVGNDLDIPIGSGGTNNYSFCIASNQNMYTIGRDYDNPGISVASLGSSTWNASSLEQTSESRTNLNIVASGTAVYAGYTNPNGDNPVIYSNGNGAWTKLPSMANSTTAQGTLSIACAPSGGALYAAHMEGTSAVIKKYSGASWVNVPATGNGTAFISNLNLNYIQIIPGTKKCYAFVRSNSEYSIWQLSLN